VHAVAVPPRSFAKPLLPFGLAPLCVSHCTQISV
jgi:hypothetical protein